VQTTSRSGMATWSAQQQRDEQPGQCPHDFDDGSGPALYAGATSRRGWLAADGSRSGTARAGRRWAAWINYAVRALRLDDSSAPQRLAAGGSSPPRAVWPQTTSRSGTVRPGPRWPGQSSARFCPHEGRRWQRVCAWREDTSPPRARGGEQHAVEPPTGSALGSGMGGVSGSLPSRSSTAAARRLAGGDFGHRGWRGANSSKWNGSSWPGQWEEQLRPCLTAPDDAAARAHATSPFGPATNPRQVGRLLRDRVPLNQLGSAFPRSGARCGGWHRLEAKSRP
jgi:hypothetical protein